MLLHQTNANKRDDVGFGEAEGQVFQPLILDSYLHRVFECEQNVQSLLTGEVVQVDAGVQVS